MRTVQLTANNGQDYGSFYEATRIPIVELVGRHAPTAKSGDLDRPTWCTVAPALCRVWQLEQRLQTGARWWTKGARERMLTHYSHDADREHGILESPLSVPMLHLRCPLGTPARLAVGYRAASSWTTQTTCSRSTTG